MDGEALISAVIVVIAVLAIVLANRRPLLSKVGGALLFLSPVIGRIANATPANYWQAAAAPFLLRRNWDLLRHPVVLAFLALGAWNAIVSLWSPDRMGALSNSIRQVAIALFIAGFFASYRRDASHVRSSMAWLAPLLVLQSVATIIFIIFPAVELSYLSSPLAIPLLGPEAAGIATGETNQNVESATKAGGLLFLNGNRASMVMGAGAMVYFALAVSGGASWAWAVATVSFLGAAATLSKTGLALAAFAPLAVLIVRALIKRGSALKSVLILVGALLLLTLAGIAVVLASGHSVVLQKALLPRARLWGAAVDLWLQAPLQGRGYGSWEAWWYETAYQWGINRHWPPHNAFLAEATRGGAVGVILLLVICAVVIRQILQGIRAANGRRERTIAALCVYAMLWPIFHALGDNTDVWGTLNSVPFIVAAMLIPQLARTDAPLLRSEKRLPVAALPRMRH